MLTLHSLSKQTASALAAPSGIAQLRKTSDLTAQESQDAMNLDEFIFTDSISTPAGLGTSPSPEQKGTEAASSTNAVAAAIPIKARKDSAPVLVPQSVPVHPGASRGQEEFGYVQRTVRKTSIDERRVCLAF